VGDSIIHGQYYVRVCVYSQSADPPPDSRVHGPGFYAKVAMGRSHVSRRTRLVWVFRIQALLPIRTNLNS
jgi:hypothetical protein